MNTKKIVIVLSVISLLYFPFLQSCSSDDDSSDPSNQQQLVGIWTLEELLVDSVPFLGSIADYRLELNGDMTYSLTQVDKVTTSGTWSLINNDSVLILGTEEYVVSSLSVDQAILIGSQASTKTGNIELTYTLALVK